MRQQTTGDNTFSTVHNLDKCMSSVS